MEEHETISGEDAKRVLRGEEMKDCYNVTTIQRSEDDDMDKEIYEARYKKEKVEEKEEIVEEKEEEEKEVVVKVCEACAKKEEQIEAQQARLCVMDAELVKTRRVAREKVTMRTDGEA